VILPATTPEQIDAALRAMSSSGEKDRSVLPRVVIALMLLGTVGFLVVAIHDREWRSGPITAFLYAAACLMSAVATTYKINIVTTIDPLYVERRTPLPFLSWRIQASEIRLIDIELEQHNDVIRFETKSGGTRRLEIARGVTQRLRRS
jgi:hypothetical protein